jgi:hypothetical protein
MSRRLAAASLASVTHSLVGVEDTSLAVFAVVQPKDRRGSSWYSCQWKLPQGEYMFIMYMYI